MNSIERIRNAIRMKRVDKIPLDFEYFGETDIKWLFVRPPFSWKPKRYKPWYMDIDIFREIAEEDKYSKREDEWGTIWGYGNVVGIIGEALEYPIKNIDHIKRYKFPNPEASGRFDGFSEQIKKNKDKYIIVAEPMCLFEKLHFLLGFNETLLGIIKNPKEIEYFLDKLVDNRIRLFKHLNVNFSGKVHAINTSDDWGTQDNLFIDPKIWRKMFKPRYKKIIDEVHKNNFDFWFHSDGKIEEIIPDLIEIGVDVFLMPQNSSIRDIEEFGREFAGKVCHCLYIDIQSTAIYGSEKEIKEEAEKLVKYWSNEYGSGVIATDYTDPLSIAATNEKRKIALEAFKEAFTKKINGSL